MLYYGDRHGWGFQASLNVKFRLGIVDRSLIDKLKPEIWIGDASLNVKFKLGVVDRSLIGKLKPEIG